MNNLKNFFKNTTLSKFVYPAILALGAITIIIVFVLSTRFLTREINRVFAVDAVGNDFSIDLAHYRLVARKLGLPQDIAGTPAVTSETVSSAPAIEASTSTPSVTASSTPPLDKSAITMAVYNATSVKGLAAQAKDKLVAAGFTVSKTGNAEAQSTNTITLKESAMEYLPLLREALGSAFADAAVTTAATNATHDAVITIGVR